MTIPRLTVVGVHGHGSSHLATAVRAHHDGRALLVAVADPAGPPRSLPDGVRHFDDSTSMFSAVDSDVSIVSTPIHTHASIAVAAMDAGNDVLLEKPPTASLEEFALVQEVAAARGRRVQVGFQSLASSAIPHLRGLIASGAIGEVLRYGASAAWVRPIAYWRRADWAGRRSLRGRVVADGVLTNPLAHATATALAVAGCQGVDQVRDIELSLFRANDIEADDTSVAVMTLETGVKLTTAATLCAPEREEPFVEVVGTRGRLVFYYAIDVVQRFSEESGALPHTTMHKRVPLLDDLLAAREGERTLNVPLAATGGFMRLLQAVQDAPSPVAIPPEAIDTIVDGQGERRVVKEVVPFVRRALDRSETFRSLEVPWL